MTTNYIQFENNNIETANGKGKFSTISLDVDLIVEVNESTNPLAPTHRVYGLSPAGHKIELGAVWKKLSKKETEYFTITGNHLAENLRANLGKFPEQDDESLQAIIPWDK